MRGITPVPRRQVPDREDISKMTHVPQPHGYEANDGEWKCSHCGFSRSHPLHHNSVISAANTLKLGDGPMVEVPIGHAARSDSVFRSLTVDELRSVAGRLENMRPVNVLMPGPEIVEGQEVVDNNLLNTIGAIRFGGYVETFALGRLVRYIADMMEE